jgi:hypothetical protein
VPNGSSTYDVCDVCGGNASTCGDCRGVPNGSSTYDVCDVCGGNGSTCRDCRGVPNGSSAYDECGVCGGDNGCRVLFHRWFKLTLDRPYETWDWPDFRTQLAQYLKVSASEARAVLRQYRPAERGSVISFIEHKANTSRTVELDALWDSVQQESSLSATSIERRPVEEPTSMDVATQSTRAPPDDSILSASLSEGANDVNAVEFLPAIGGWLGVGVIIGGIAAVLVLIACITCFVLRLRRRRSAREVPRVQRSTPSGVALRNMSRTATATSLDDLSDEYADVESDEPQTEQTIEVSKHAKRSATLGDLKAVEAGDRRASAYQRPAYGTAPIPSAIREGYAPIATAKREAKGKSGIYSTIDAPEPVTLSSSAVQSYREGHRKAAYDEVPAIARDDMRSTSPNTSRKHKTGYYDTPPAAGELDGNAKASSSERRESGSTVRKRDSELMWRIAMDEIELGKKLGEGAFGVVWKGKWHGKNVAVKQVKADALDAKAKAEFEAEVAQMAVMQPHENLVLFFGVTTLENGDVAAVVEFCAQGSLVDALYGDGQRDWTTAEQVRVAHDAACGVAHLHRLDIVHRDIAARNVLLAGKGDAVVGKVADFGMARAVSDEVYEQQTAQKIGPLKWMAPEQIERQAYSKASDVFAFGVLLYEIFAREVPWKGVTAIMSVQKVLSGERMEPPRKGTPRELRKLMRGCWEQRAKDRPAMSDAQSTIGELLEDESYNTEE